MDLDASGALEGIPLSSQLVFISVDTFLLAVVGTRLFGTCRFLGLEQLAAGFVFFARASES